MISEADAEDYKQQDREDKRREFLERRARMGGPDAPEPCEKCDGQGEIVYSDTSLGRGGYAGQTISSGECPRCLGTGVQP